MTTATPGDDQDLQPVCACNYFRQECDDCNEGWMTVLKSGKACKMGPLIENCCIFYFLVLTLNIL